MMNSSAAKVFSTLFAAGALGAVAIACSVSSGTVDDTDGGSSGNASSTSSSSGVTTSSSSSSSGAAGDGGLACSQLTYGSVLYNSACDTCLREKCCTETSGCWNKAADDATTKEIGCDSYSTSLNDCDNNAETADPNDCKGFVKTSAQKDIPGLYDTYLTCLVGSCNAECNSDAEVNIPDGGTK